MLTGISGSSGYGIGKVFCYHAFDPEIREEIVPAEQRQTQLLNFHAALAAAGAHVILTARGTAALEQVEERIHAAGGKATIEGLKSAEGYIRRELARRVNLRNTPEIKFILDQSIEYGVNMSKLIDEVTKDIKE